MNNPKEIIVKEINKIGYCEDYNNLEYNSIEWSNVDGWERFERDGVRWYGPFKLNRRDEQFLKSHLEPIAHSLGIDITKIEERIEKVNVKKLLEMVAKKIENNLFETEKGILIRII